MYVCDELGFIPQANATRFCCHINIISPIEEVMPEWYHLFFVFPLVASSSPSVILETDLLSSLCFSGISSLRGEILRGDNR